MKLWLATPYPLCIVVPFANPPCAQSFHLYTFFAISSWHMLVFLFLHAMNVSLYLFLWTPQSLMHVCFYYLKANACALPRFLLSQHKHKFKVKTHLGFCKAHVQRNLVTSTPIQKQISLSLTFDAKMKLGPCMYFFHVDLRIYVPNLMKHGLFEYLIH